MRLGADTRPARGTAGLELWQAAAVPATPAATTGLAARVTSAGPVQAACTDAAVAPMTAAEAEALEALVGMHTVELADVAEQAWQEAGGAPTEIPQVVRLTVALANAHGEARAITAERLAVAVFGVADGAARGGNNSGAVRRVRQLLATYLDRLPWPVAAGDAGYYRPATQAEAEHYYASLASRASEIEARAWTFARQCRCAGWQIGPDDPAHERLAAHHQVLRGRAV